MHRPIGSLWKRKRSDPLLRDFVVQVISNGYEGENLCKVIGDSLVGLELLLSLSDTNRIWEPYSEDLPEGI